MERNLYENFRVSKISFSAICPAGQDPTGEQLFETMHLECDGDSQETVSYAFRHFLRRHRIDYLTPSKVMKHTRGKQDFELDESEILTTEKTSHGSIVRRMRIIEEFDSGWIFKWTVPTIICRLKCPVERPPSYGWDKLKRKSNKLDYCWLTPITLSEQGTPIEFAVSSTFEVLLEFSRHWAILDYSLNIPTRVSQCQGASDNDLMKRKKCIVQLSGKEESKAFFDDKQIKSHNRDRIVVQSEHQRKLSGESTWPMILE